MIGITVNGNENFINYLASVGANYTIENGNCKLNEDVDKLDNYLDGYYNSMIEEAVDMAFQKAIEDNSEPVEEPKKIIIRDSMEDLVIYLTRAGWKTNLIMRPDGAVYEFDYHPMLENIMDDYLGHCIQYEY